MKIITDFITNSSSASFIIAFKDCVKIEHIRDFIPKDKFIKWVKSHVSDWDYELSELEELEDINITEDEELLDVLYKKICDRFLNLSNYPDLELPGYNISGIEGNSEDFDIFRNMLYDEFFCDTDFIIYNLADN